MLCGCRVQRWLNIGYQPYSAFYFRFTLESDDGSVMLIPSYNISDPQILVDDSGAGSFLRALLTATHGMILHIRSLSMGMRCKIFVDDGGLAIAATS